MRLSINTQKKPSPYSFSNFADFAKALQLHHRLSSVAAAEEAAEQLGYVLIPAVCLSWRKRNKLGEQRRIKVHDSFYAVRLDELTDLERNKFFKYCENIKGVYVE